jgi:hypothetical protein
MEEDFIQLGTFEQWGNRHPFGLLRADRRQHLYVVGKSGTGKSTLLKNLLIQAIESGEGVALIDPHGDLSLELLDAIPPWRTDHVVYFDAADAEHPIGLNLLLTKTEHERHLVVSGIVGAFKGIWGDSWGPRLEYLLANTLSALLHAQNVSLLGVPRLLTDERYRDWVVRQITDPVVLRFWQQEYESWDQRQRTEAANPILNKVGRLLTSPLTRNILGQVKSRIDAEFIMNHRRILIANLSKGRIGADHANLLGALLVAQFQLAALRRAGQSEQERVDFSLVVDEWHNFVTEDFAHILSEARKYRLGIVLAGQFIAQTQPTLRDAVFGNVGTILSFRVGESDATMLAREFGNDFTTEHFTDLDNHVVCIKGLEDGRQRVPFVARTLPPVGNHYGCRENLIRRSRERFATPRAMVQDKIARWFSSHR